jgi:hypothetical protein
MIISFADVENVLLRGGRFSYEQCKHLPETLGPASSSYVHELALHAQNRRQLTFHCSVHTTFPPDFALLVLGVCLKPLCVVKEATKAH